MVWVAQSVVQSGALWDRLPLLRYVVVSTVSGAVWSIVGQPRLRDVVVREASGTVGRTVGQIAKITVCSG